MRHRAMHLEGELPDPAAATAARQRITVVIPAYNEAKTLGRVLADLRALPGVRFDEILVVDDGSTDGTAEVAGACEGVVVIRTPYNKGNGAAVKAGIRRASGDLVLVLDADGQHTPDQVPALLTYMPEYDLVVGSRARGHGVIRNVGNALLNRFSSLLSGVTIPDLTSGLRLARRPRLMEFMHLYPNGFSFPATSTLAFISAGYNVKFVTVDVRERGGDRSKLRLLRDANRFVIVVLRLVATFYPLKVFVPASAFSVLMAVFWSIRTMAISGQVSAVGAIFLIVGVFLLLFGLLADQVAGLRMEIGRMAKPGDS